MISFNFNIHNPWSNTWKILWNKSKVLSKNKAVEFNGYRTNHIINADLQIKTVGDHGGFHIMLGLFGYEVELHFYDTRHWDYARGKWEERSV